MPACVTPSAIGHGSRSSATPVSKAKYAALRGRGHDHARGLRAVADRLLAVACAVLRTPRPATGPYARRSFMRPDLLSRHGPTGRSTSAYAPRSAAAAAISGGSEGAQPSASPSRGHAECGHGGYPGSPALAGESDPPEAPRRRWTGPAQIGLLDGGPSLQPGCRLRRGSASRPDLVRGSSARSGSGRQPRSRPGCPAGERGSPGRSRRLPRWRVFRRHK